MLVEDRQGLLAVAVDLVGVLGERRGRAEQTEADHHPGHEFHGPYHDTEYGFHSADERVLFERLALEIMQAGLSWLIVLKKRRGMNAAFDDFQVDKVARQ